MKTIEFRVRGDDPTLSKLKAMLEGIASQAMDASLKISEARLVTVTTKNDDVAAVLASVAKLNQVGKPQKKTYRKRTDPTAQEE